MKTILVIYTFERLSKKAARTSRRYSFNTEARVSVGDMFEAEEYATPMQVVEILPKTYRYVDTNSGELSNRRKASTKQFEIRTLEIREDRDNAIVATPYIAD